MIRSKHATTQEAWEWINEFLVTREDKVKRNGGVVSGGQVISYDHFMEINKAWVDPEFDFGFMFGYKMQKWSILRSNYVDMNMVDLVRSEVLEREFKKSQNYNLAFKFVNTHGHGHGCLISLVFQRRYSHDNPVVIINIRASEVTKRLLMDFLLVQRITEYIYGDDVSASVKLFAGNMWVSAENFVMYHNHKPFESFMKPEHGGMEKKTLDILHKFQQPEAMEIKYKVHLRAVKRIQQVSNPPLKAKDLLL
jgi:hypothetical protein